MLFFSFWRHEAFSYELREKNGLTRRGKFLCTPDGKIVISRNIRKDGATDIFCITNDGRKYNATTGELLGRTALKNNHYIGSDGNYVADRSAKHRGGKKVLIVNNYEEEEEVAAPPKNDFLHKNRGPIKPFNGFYLGLRAGSGFSQIHQIISEVNNKNPSVGPGTDPGLRYSYTSQSVNTLRIHAITGINWQITRRLLFGIDTGFAIMSNDNLAIPLDDNNVLFPYFLQSSRGIMDAQFRVGVVAANTVLLYTGVGFDLFMFKEVNSYAGGSSSGFSVAENFNYSIAPRFSIGAEWLVKGHIGLRVEYAFTYMSDHNTNAVHVDDKVSWSLLYGSMRHVVTGGIYYKF
ncbi:MAG: hypothetical protein JJW01_00550 [Alphaproteobacteria bacterium]|nr:hypothetical protein [Rickettsiales bacterium]